MSTNYLKTGENTMKDQSQIETAWQIWHLISRLNDLIWTHYEKEFLDLVKKNDPFKPGNQIDDRPF
jgi:hypothetical protein